MSDSRVTPWWLATAAYAGLTIAFTWPLVTRVTSALPHDAYDPALNTAILSWNAHAVPLTAGWWDAPMFWPMSGALALSEHLLGVSLVASPVQWLGADPVTAYNIVFLLSFPLCALAAHALAFTLVKRHDVACLAGCIFGFSPYRVSELAHLQMLWAFGMPLALMALHRFLEQRERRWLVVFGLAWLAQAASNGYYMLFFLVLLAAWVLWFAREPKSLVPITVTWSLASLPLAPLLWVYSSQHAAMGLSRPIHEIEGFSADLMSPLTASPDLIVWHGLSRWSHSQGQLFPGALALVLIGAAIAVAAARPRALTARDAGWRLARTTAGILAAGFLAIAVSVPVSGPWKWTVGTHTLASASSIDKPLSVAAALLLFAAIASETGRSLWHRRSVFGFYVCAAAATLILSFGPRPRLAGTPVLYRAPYYWLLELPGFSELRVPARFGMLFVLCIAIAAALAFAKLASTLPSGSRRALAMVAAALMLLESWPRVALAVPAAPIPALRAIDLHAPVLELPLGFMARDVAAVYRSLDHGHPTVNGYSGYDPPHYQVLRIGLRLDDGGMIDELARGHSLLVAVDHDEQFDRWAAVVGPHPVVADEGGWRLYRVAAGAEVAGPAPGPRLPIRSVAANFQNDAVSRMLDGDPTTAWSTGRIQTGGEELLIDLGRPSEVADVRLTLGPFFSDFPRRLSVECSVDRRQWDVCWRGSAAALALRATLDDPLIATMIIPVAGRAARYVRLRQTGVDAVNGWAVAELAVIGR